MAPSVGPSAGRADPRSDVVHVDKAEPLVKEALAMVELSNYTGDPSLDWIAAAMGEMLESRLAIEGFQTLRVAADTLKDPRSAASENAPERVLRGSYSVLDNGSASELYFLVRIEDVARLQMPLAWIEGMDPPGDIFHRRQGDLVEAVDVDHHVELSAEAEGELLRTLPIDPELEGCFEHVFVTVR